VKGLPAFDGTQYDVEALVPCFFFYLFFKINKKKKVIQNFLYYFHKRHRNIFFFAIEIFKVEEKKNLKK